VSEPSIGISELPDAVESGRICAVAGQAQRAVREWAGHYPRLFPPEPFDPALYNTVCLCTAFSSPSLTSRDLLVANRAAIWGFGVDWLIDYIATSRAEVDKLVEGCLAVADGAAAPGEDELLCALADIRDELTPSSAFTALRHAWYDQLRRFLHAMAREWDWNAAHVGGEQTRPTLDDYLANTDNFGFAFVFVSHWISTGEPPPAADVPRIREASWAAQRAMRLINDLGTYERDVQWGDLNALMLGVSPTEVHDHIAILTRRFREVADPLRVDYPRLISYIERQMAFCVGFYEITDYWGRL
jgi:hypothetical protein